MVARVEKVNIHVRGRRCWPIPRQDQLLLSEAFALKLFNCTWWHALWDHSRVLLAWVRGLAVVGLREQGLLPVWHRHYGDRDGRVHEQDLHPRWDLCQELLYRFLSEKSTTTAADGRKHTLLEPSTDPQNELRLRNLLLPDVFELHCDRVYSQSENEKGGDPHVESCKKLGNSIRSQNETWGRRDHRRRRAWARHASLQEERKA